jgi:hypothetical protein
MSKSSDSIFEKAYLFFRKGESYLQTGQVFFSFENEIEEQFLQWI